MTNNANELNVILDGGIHLNAFFSYDSREMELSVEEWSISDLNGQLLNIHSFSFADMQYTMQEIFAAIEDHKAEYLDEAETAFYQARQDYLSEEAV
jgi:hypothetical protein